MARDTLRDFALATNQSKAQICQQVVATFDVSRQTYFNWWDRDTPVEIVYRSDNNRILRIWVGEKREVTKRSD